MLVNADGAAVRIRVASSPPHLLPRRGLGRPCNHQHQENAACRRTARWRAKAVGQRSAGEDTPRKKETPRPPPTPARVLSTPIQTAANHARLVLSTPIPTAANHFLRVRRPPCARSAPAHRPQSSAHETATPTLRLQRPFTVLQNNSQQRTRLSDVTAPAFQHVARCPHYAEEALDAVLVPQVVNGRVHADA